MKIETFKYDNRIVRAFAIATIVWAIVGFCAGLLAAVRARGHGLQQRLQSTFEQHPHIGDIRGRGLFWGVELVADRATKSPFDPQLKLHARIRREAMAQGLMVYPMGGTLDGRLGDHVLLAPPFIVGEEDLDRIVQGLAAAVEAALVGVAA